MSIRTLWYELAANVPDTCYGIPGKQFARLIMDWYAAQKRSARDKLSTLKMPPDLRKVPAATVYRYIMLKPELVVRMVRDKKPIKLKDIPSSSWSIKPDRGMTGRGDLVCLTVKKKLRAKDVAFYSP